MPNNEKEICCSFCGKSQDEVTRLVEGPGVYICDSCIEFCSALLFDDENTAKKKKIPILCYLNRKKLKPRLTNM